MATRQFGIDIISVLPTDLFYILLGVDASIVRINRVFRISRMREFFERTDSRTNYPHIFRLVQLVIVVIICLHWNGCFYYQISVWIGLGVDPWVSFKSLV